MSQVDFFQKKPLKQKAGGCVLLGSSAVDEEKEVEQEEDIKLQGSFNGRFQSPLHQVLRMG